jgi:hypothetical protein
MDFATNSLCVESVTPEKAAEYLNYNYAHNRKLRKHHVAFLANEMRCGRFMPTAEIHLMFRNGDPVLVNGQHTCAAIVQHGKPVTVTVRKTLVREAGQIALTYAFGHDTGLRRTFNDAMGAYSIAEATGLTQRQVEALSSAIRHIKSSFSKARSGEGNIKQSPADIVEYIYAWANEAKVLFTVTDYCDKDITRLLKKTGALAVAILTIRYQPEKALEFWRGVAMPDGVLWADPRMTARRALEDSKGKAGTKGITPGKLSRQLARAWNAYCKGEELKQIKVNDEYASMVLLGTPYNGRQSEGFLSLNTAPATTTTLLQSA